MIAAAAERTRSIRLATGVISLPYHHPLVVADRLNMLDHLSGGRLIFGAGPGAFPSDAYVMGIDYMSNREHMTAKLEAIIELLTSDEPVTRETEWFVLRDARLNLRPYTRPCFEIVVTAVATATGPKLAGRLGTGLLSLSVNSPKDSTPPATPGRSPKNPPPNTTKPLTAATGASPNSATSPRPTNKPDAMSATDSPRCSTTSVTSTPSPPSTIPPSPISTTSSTT